MGAIYEPGYRLVPNEISAKKVDCPLRLQHHEFCFAAELSFRETP